MEATCTGPVPTAVSEEEGAEEVLTLGKREEDVNNEASHLLLLIVRCPEALAMHMGEGVLHVSSKPEAGIQVEYT